jgi:AMP nucleosidase
MKTKEEIVNNWLPRYTGVELDKLGRYILLANFIKYVDEFAEITGTEVVGRDKAMPSATFEDITMINFGMGSANAATVMDLLSAISPKACLFLGKCGGLKKKNKIGDIVLPIAAIKGEGASNSYMPSEVPALPAFSLQRAVSHSVREHDLDYWTGTVYTTSRRVWEHDEEFKEYLRKLRCMAIDMETSAIFTAGFANSIPTGALLLVSDQPMVAEGVKTDKSDNLVTKNFVQTQIKIGIEALKELINDGRSVKHLRFE